MVNSLYSFIAGQGWDIVEEKDMPSGRQVVLSDGMNKAYVTLYRTGTILIQGPTSPLRASLVKWKQETDPK